LTALIVRLRSAEVPYRDSVAGRTTTTTTPPELLGHAVPDLLYAALAERPNPQALNDCVAGSWRSTTTAELAERVEATALGLRELGLAPGERIALFMESDSAFVVADLGSLLAGLVDVPLYLTNSAEANGFVVLHSGAEALVVSTPAQLAEILPVVADVPALELVIVAEPGPSANVEPPPGWPERARLISLGAVEQAGRARRARDDGAVNRLRDELRPEALATIVYTSGTTGQPKGVQLSHQNLSSNAIAAFAAVPEVRRGASERALSFLPLTHAFGRTLFYGFLHEGNGVWFTQPQAVGKHLREVRPTLLPSVPRVLERVWERILGAGHQLTGWRRRLFDRAVRRASAFDPERERGLLESLEHRLLDALVYRRWREATGGELNMIISGGAALRPEIARALVAAGIPACQGYGLTEASPIVSTNEPSRNRIGTVGRPLPGVELRIAEDGEVLTRGPQVMLGYYRDPEATAETIGPDGWLHTGDVGEIDEDGFLRITDRKKDLFKLSTGKYVSPAPIEQRLAADPLVDQAVVVGYQRKFCGALLFPNPDTVRAWARRHGVGEGLELDGLLARPEVQSRFEEVVEATNRHLSDWERVKRFRLVSEAPTVENGLLTPTLKVRRRVAWKAHAGLIDALYGEAEREPAPAER
jgi:long-chain acyl-CoA synthetase